MREREKVQLFSARICYGASRRRLTINAQLYSFRDTWRNSVLNLDMNRPRREMRAGRRERNVKIIDYSH